MQEAAQGAAARMRVFLAGATGVIGRRLLPLLIAAGHEVTAMTRSDDARGRAARSGRHAGRVRRVRRGGRARRDGRPRGRRSCCTS